MPNLYSDDATMLYEIRKNMGSWPVHIGQRMSFDDALLFHKPKLVQTFEFGSAKTSIDGIIPIRDLSEVAAYWNPLEDFTGLTTINSEMQRYASSFGSATHVMESDCLTLKAGIDTSGGYAGGWTADIKQTGTTSIVPNGSTVIPIANLGRSTTAGMEVGQLMALQYLGIYYISAIDPNVSIVLTRLESASSTSGGANNLNAVLPIFSASSSADHTNGTNVISFASLPAGVAVGMQVGYVSGTAGLSRNDDIRVQSISGGVVTLTKNTSWGTKTSGTRFVFLPPIISGQIWSKQGWDMLGGRSAQFFDFDLKMPYSPVTTRGVNTLAALNGLDAETAWGAWPAVWLYQKNDGYTTSPAELDLLEIYYSTTNGLSAWSGGNLQGVTNLRNLLFLRTSQGYADGGSNFVKTDDGRLFCDANRRLRMSFLKTPDRTYRWVNGVLLRADSYAWDNQNNAQVGVNLACGSLVSGQAANFLFPQKAANFNQMGYSIERMRVFEVA